MTDGSDAYGNFEHCEFEALRLQTIMTTEYAVERGDDYISIGGTKFKQAPNELLLPGTKLQWRTDKSTTYGGFKICAVPYTFGTRKIKLILQILV